MIVILKKDLFFNLLFLLFQSAPVTPGSDGEVESSYLQKGDLSLSVKKKYPLALIKLMTRYGEDLIWSNKITKAEAVLKFVVTLTEGRSDASELRKGKVVRNYFFFCERLLLNKNIRASFTRKISRVFHARLDLTK